jgi:hypothetical protein
MADAWDQPTNTPVGRLAHPDKSPRVANRALHQGAAEMSSFDTVSHYLLEATRLRGSGGYA